MIQTVAFGSRTVAGLILAWFIGGLAVNDPVAGSNTAEADDGHPFKH